MRPGLRLRGAAGALGLALAGVAAAADPIGNAIDEQIDRLVRAGYEQPAQAVAALDRLQREAPAWAQRPVLLAMGSVEAQAGRATEAGALAERLLLLGRETGDPLAAPSSNLVRAQVAETAGQADVAAALAQSALAAFEAGCPELAPRGLLGPYAAPPAGLASAPLAALPAPACDHRALWRALNILERRSLGQGVTVAAMGHAQAAHDVAEWAGDPYRQALSQSALAVLKALNGYPGEADYLMLLAKRQAAQIGDAELQTRVRINEARLADARGDRPGSLRAFEEALSHAVRADASRLEALVLVNLSDTYAKLGRPADALRAAERALPTARRHNDLRTERVLINNAGLAKIGLGRTAEGKLDMQQALELWRRSGETASQAQTLREFGEALAAVGDGKGALELYHRERALTAEVLRVNRNTALKELQTRNDAEAKQRNIVLLSRDNALKSAALLNSELTQRVWMLAATVLSLSILVAMLLYRRVRVTHRQLEASQARLRVQSESDPLTNLANRRHFQVLMAQRSATDGFEGTLLLIDIDHFKHINDAHGHAVGDQVLVEVARRLNDAVRNSDLVVRWGGEEFLVLAFKPSADGMEQAEQMAERVLSSIGGAPMAVGDLSLDITVSLGYARFPLPPYAVPVSWEQALNLTDMALYTAKSRGRNRAVGITSSAASSAVAMREVEANFDRAAHEGRVTLLQIVGPPRRGER